MLNKTCSLATVVIKCHILDVFCFLMSFNLGVPRTGYKK